MGGRNPLSPTGPRGAPPARGWTERVLAGGCSAALLRGLSAAARRSVSAGAVRGRMCGAAGGGVVLGASTYSVTAFDRYHRELLARHADQSGHGSVRLPPRRRRYA